RTRSGAGAGCSSFPTRRSSDLGVRILTPRHADSGLLTFAVEGLDPERVVKELWEKRRIVIRSIPKPRALRASFHAFNNEGDVERSEEHTSELQSRENLVCRLML